MARVNVHEAKTQLSQLLVRVESGEEIIIARAGTPVARLVPIQPTGKRVLGRLAGQVQVSEDFDAPSPDVERMFEGE